MGKQFGNLAHIRGILYYKLSPHEQRAYAKSVSFGIPNFVPRTLARIGMWLPVFVAGYVTYVTCETLHHHSKRKDFRIYDDEVMPEGYEFPEEESRGKTNKKK